MIVGEGPAKEEVRNGIPFCGRSGRELDHQYLPLAALVRDQCWVTNVRKCPLSGFANPTVPQASLCAERHLKLELRYHQPEIVVTLGAVACHTLFPDCDFQMEVGLPRYNQQLWDWEGCHVPLFHPAAGLHSDEFMIPLQWNFTNLRLIHRGEFQLPVDRFPSPSYLEIHDQSHLDSLFATARWDNIAMDTETVPPGLPWCLSFSLSPGTGYVIPNSRLDLCRSLAHHISRCKLMVILHNAMFDLDILRSMGISITRFDDTMVRAYHLGNVRQSLKWLAYRFCGMHMQEFEDLVLPYARTVAVEWLRDAQERLSKGVDRPVEEKLGRVSYRGLSKLATVMARSQDRQLRLALHEQWQLEMEQYRSKPQVHALSLVNRLAGDMDNDVVDKEGLPVNPWKRWGDWPGEVVEAITNAMGTGLPLPNIEQVPRPLAIHYSARDSDATLRIRGELIKRGVEMRRQVA